LPLTLSTGKNLVSLYVGVRRYASAYLSYA